jgi:hypothetical protein
MSYNIDTFNLKKLENFSFPVASLYKNERKDWHPDRINNDDGTVTFTNLETRISGKIENDTFYMDKIYCSAEGSGTVMNDMLEPAFRDSKGILIASCVWGGGDSINRLEVNDGEVLWINIEI